MAMVVDSFKEGFQIFKNDLGPWVATTFVWSLAASVAGSVIPIVGGLVLLPNMVREASNAVEQRRSPELANIFEFGDFGDDLVSMIFYAGSQVVGSLFCCIGWPIAWIGFWYSAELAADGRVAPADTMKISWMWAKNNLGQTLGMALLGVLLNTIGATVGLGVGVILTLPVTVLAWVVYWHRVRDDVYAMAASEGYEVATRQPAALQAEQPFQSEPLGQTHGRPQELPQPHPQGRPHGEPQQTDGFVGSDD